MPRFVVHLIANAHLDPVWLWDWQEGLTEGMPHLPHPDGNSTGCNPEHCTVIDGKLPLSSPSVRNKGHQQAIRSRRESPQGRARLTADLWYSCAWLCTIICLS